MARSKRSTDINLHVEQGEVVTLIGANGAGKTTTLAHDHRLARTKGRPRHVRRQADQRSADP